MGNRLYFAAALVGLLALSGCAGQPAATAESLATAEATTSAPSDVSWTYWGVQGVSLDWSPIQEARGYQYQYAPAGSDEWVDANTDSWSLDYADRLGGSDVLWGPDSAPAMDVHFRAILSDGQVSDWALIPAIPSASSITPSCLSAFQESSEESTAGGWSETALASTTTRCGDRAEWLTAAAMLPNVLGMTEATTADVQQFLGILCRSYPQGLCLS